jgi:hypothetical protein
MSAFSAANPKLVVFSSYLAVIVSILNGFVLSTCAGLRSFLRWIFHLLYSTWSWWVMLSLTLSYTFIEFSYFSSSKKLVSRSVNILSINIHCASVFFLEYFYVSRTQTSLYFLYIACNRRPGRFEFLRPNRIFSTSFRVNCHFCAML